MDEIGIPIFDEPRNDLSSPIMIRKLQSQNHNMSPVGSPYENVYFKNNLGFKPKSPNTQSPRTRIKTTFAHKNLPSPQYFIFPTPSPVENTTKPNFDISSNNENKDTTETNREVKISGIEKQLSLEEEIPMIDDDLTNELEFRYSKIISDKNDDISENIEINDQTDNIETLTKNKSFDDVKKELMADIPELEEFEKDLKQNIRNSLIRDISDDIKKIDNEVDSIGSAILDENLDELKSRFENLKEERRKLVAEIHEIKCKMTDIRSQEDDILREVCIYYFFLVY